MKDPQKDPPLQFAAEAEGWAEEGKGGQVKEGTAMEPVDVAGPMARDEAG